MAKAKYVLPKGYKKSDVSYFNDTDKVYMKDGKVFGVDGIERVADPVAAIDAAIQADADKDREALTDGEGKAHAVITDASDPANVTVTDTRDAVFAKPKDTDTGDVSDHEVKRKGNRGVSVPPTAQPKAMSGKYPASMDDMPDADQINGYK
jgi:hypothetical protein